MRKKVKPFLNHAITKVPLVEVQLHLITTSDLAKTVNSKDFLEIFPDSKGRTFVDHGYYGITFYDYDRGRVAIILSPEGLNHNVIHHEIHHATLRIGTHIGCSEVHGTSEEFFAQIGGWVGDFVYQFLALWKHKITALDPSIVSKSEPVTEEPVNQPKGSPRLLGVRKAERPKGKSVRKEPKTSRKRPSRKG